MIFVLAEAIAIEALARDLERGKGVFPELEAGKGRQHARTVRDVRVDHADIVGKEAMTTQSQLHGGRRLTRARRTAKCRGVAVDRHAGRMQRKQRV